MFISRVRLSEAPSAASLLRLVGDRLGPYETHRLVWSLFADQGDRRRDFLYRMDQHDGRPEYHIVSSRPPEDRHNLFRIETKDFQPDLRAGDRLRVMTRINPVWRKDVAGKQRKVDVVMDELQRRRAAGDDTSADRNAIAQETVPAWLDHQGDRSGFRLLRDAFVAESYEIAEFRSRDGHAVRIAGVDCRAELEVVDADACRSMLFGGLGPSRAFGYGLVLARRA